MAPTHPTLVTVQFRVALSRQELVDAWTPEAPEIARIPGLEWKIWALDEPTRRYAGVYLFSSVASAQAFLAGPVPQALRQDPHLSDVTAQAHGVLESLSRATRAPLG
jgi:hypothetical protein